MATFKVGQRVRKIGPLVREGPRAVWAQVVPLGAVGAIQAVGPDVDGREYTVTYDAYGPHHGAMGYQLAPLTDPGTDAFIEKIKKLEPLREPATV